MNLPDNLLYTKDHEWALQKNGVVVIGITDYAQNQLGDVVFTELPSVGTQVEKGKEFGAVESVKAASDLFSPVTGEVVKVNEALADAPDTVNHDPYEKGWMIEIKLKDPKELADLLKPEQYKELVTT